jgi:hypothetical protein
MKESIEKVKIRREGENPETRTGSREKDRIKRKGQDQATKTAQRIKPYNLERKISSSTK